MKNLIKKQHIFSLDPQIYDGRNQQKSNYQPNNPKTSNVNQNTYTPSAPPAPQYPVLPQREQKPDYDPNGVALAPFPDENVDPNYGARKHFNYENLHHRYPSKPSVDNNPATPTGNSPTSVDSRLGNNDPLRVVPLASYTGYSDAQVPLAPL